MYNTDLPSRAELPSPGKLLRSTCLALVAAVAILLMFILPADYGLDPTGVGQRLGLLDMGQTKARLAAEAAADRDAADAMVIETPTQDARLGELSAKITSLEQAVRELTAAAATPREQESSETLRPADQAVSVEPSTEAQQAPVQEEPTPDTEAEETAVASQEATETPLKSDRATFTLTPGQGIEIKLVMKAGAVANYVWKTEGGPVNYDTHGEGPGGNKISYAKGRGVDTDQGSIIAAFDGNHGWFWRNRGQRNVNVTLLTKGYYSDLKGVPE